MYTSFEGATDLPEVELFHDLLVVCTHRHQLPSPVSYMRYDHGECQVSSNSFASGYM
jgi:hypothetical protein